MRLLLWVIVLFIIAISASIWLKGFSANLFFVHGDNLYEINLVTFILILFISLFLLYILVNIIIYIFSLPSRAKAKYMDMSLNNLNQNLVKSIILYFEDEYLKSINIIKNIITNKNISDVLRSVALIIGANGANKINNLEDRDFFLDQLKNCKDLNIYKNILITENCIINKDYEVAKDSIKEIKKFNSNLSKVLLLELIIDDHENNDSSIIKLTNILYKNKIISKSELDKYQINSYINLIKDSNNEKVFKSLLKKIPNEYKEDKGIVVDIARKYQELGLFNDELKWVFKYHSRNNIGLLDVLLDSFENFNDKQQLSIINEAENWLLSEPKDDKLLLFLGKITYLKELWGKSQGYLEASFNINNDMKVGLALANVLNERGKTKEAKKIYDKFLSQIKKESDII